MKVYLAKNSGFCFGVAAAFEKVKRRFGVDDFLNSKKNNNGKKSNKQKLKKNEVFILGSLVHNKNVAKAVENWGIEKINSIDKIKKGSIVIITAHGASEKIFLEIENQGATVFDTTCPKVAKIHQIVKKYSEEDCTVFIFGDKDHKEVSGIAGWCQKKPILFANEKELAQELEKVEKIEKAILVSQTTRKLSDFDKIKKILKKSKKIINLEIFDTICLAMNQRQPETQELAKRAERMIIIGGKDSANTKNLFEIAQKNNANTLWIEELDDKSRKELENFLSGAESVGIVSGASTPTWDIKEVVEFCEKF